MKKEDDVQTDLAQALQQLFGTSAAGLAFLSRPVDEPMPEGSLPERARGLRCNLVKYIKSMAAELEELGPEESERLTAEARATLIAIRELEAYIPECK